MHVKLQSAISLFTCGCLVSVAASPSSIGFVVTRGQGQVDGAVFRGNSTLFQGNVVLAENATVGSHVFRRFKSTFFSPERR